MRNDDMKKAFDSVEPSDIQKQRMLKNVLNHTDIKKKVGFMELLKPKRILTAIIMVVVVTGSLFVLKNIINTPSQNLISVGDKSNDGGYTGRDNYTEDSIAPLTNQFKIDDKTYIQLSGDYKTNVNFPQTVSLDDIGEKITTIKNGVDASLMGCDVYVYIPAGSQAVVAVKKENEYRLFSFLSFDSYINNQDEDVDRYLKLYGINSASDIAKVQFIGYGEMAKFNGKVDVKSQIVDRADVTKFYNFYSVIKNSSDKYFEKLFNYKSNTDSNIEKNDFPDEIPPDYSIGSGADKPISNREAKKVEFAQDSVQGVSGTNALNNSVTIRIYNNSGIYFDVEYYPNINFISRHEVNNAFADFLSQFIK